MGCDVNFRSDSDSIREKIDNAVNVFLEETGLHMEGQAKIALEMPPMRIDTGLLRNSITYAVGGKSPHIQSYGTDGKHRESGKTLTPEENKTGTYSGVADTKENPTVYIGTNVEYAP